MKLLLLSVLLFASCKQVREECTLYYENGTQETFVEYHRDISVYKLEAGCMSVAGERRCGVMKYNCVTTPTNK